MKCADGCTVSHSTPTIHYFYAVHPETTKKSEAQKLWQTLID